MKMKQTGGRRKWRKEKKKNNYTHEGKKNG